MVPPPIIASKLAPTKTGVDKRRPYMKGHASLVITGNSAACCSATSNPFWRAIGATVAKDSAAKAAG